MSCHSFLVLMFIKHKKSFSFINIIMFKIFFNTHIWRVLTKCLLQLLLHILYPSHSALKKLLNPLSQFMNCSTHHHWLGLKCLLRYLKSTIAFGLHITPQSPLNFHAFSNVDWVGDPSYRTSISRYLLCFCHIQLAGVPKRRKKLLDRPLKLNTGSLLQQLSRFNGLNPFLKNWVIQFHLPRYTVIISIPYTFVQPFSPK